MSKPGPMRPILRRWRLFVGAAVLGGLADRTSIGFVYRVCSYLPLVGLLTGFLPDLAKARAGE